MGCNRYALSAILIYMVAPRYCIEPNPTRQTIRFAGEYINQAAIARSQDIHTSLVSRILSGKREPSLASARKISMALGMTIDDFLSALGKHRNPCIHKSSYMECD